MEIELIAQPATQLGPRLAGILDVEQKPERVIIVSAFAALRTVLRLRERLMELAERGAAIRIIVGIDLGGTSREVLEEIASWPIEAFALHHPNPRNTFHPKVYFCES